MVGHTVRSARPGRCTLLAHDRCRMEPRLGNCAPARGLADRDLAHARLHLADIGGYPIGAARMITSRFSIRHSVSGQPGPGIYRPSLT